MSDRRGAVARTLNLRSGEGRLLATLGAFLLLVTATTTILSAAKNALFLSVYPAQYIPHVIIGAAVVTAIAAILFSGVVAGMARRKLAVQVTALFAFALVGARAAFAWDPRWSLGVYLLLSAVQVMMVTHAWDYVGDLLTGRQAKRLAPLLGIGASLGALLGGGSMPVVVAFVPTEELLFLAAALVAGSVPLLWFVPEPGTEEEELADSGQGGVGEFIDGAGRGLKGIASQPLLTLMAAGVVALTLTGTLIELQFKTALQAAMDRDQMAAVLGILSGVVGLGTLVTQLAASRWLFPRLGVSFATKLHTGLLAFASGGAALIGGVWILAALQAVEDILQFSIYKPVEQVTLLPFPGPLKSASLATLAGIVRPLSKAGAGLVAIALVAYPTVVAWLTVATAVTAFLIAIRHRELYMDSLVRALSRHSVDFSAPTDVPLVTDRETLLVLDQGLRDPDDTVVVFSVSLLAQIPSDSALPRVVAQLRHRTPEVRAEAAQVLGRLDLNKDERPVDEVTSIFEAEMSPIAKAALAATLGEWGRATEEQFLPLLNNPGEPQPPEVRRRVLVALARSGWPATSETMEGFLKSSDPEDLVVAAGAVGDLGAEEFLEEVARLVDEPLARPTALRALAELGAPAGPVLVDLLERRDLPLSVRRAVVTTLASVSHPAAQEALVSLIDEPALGPPAITSLNRLRRDNRLEPVDPARARAQIGREISQGLRCALAAASVRERGGNAHSGFIADELTGLAIRSTYRLTRLLSLSHDPEKLEAIREALGAPDARSRSNALELLEGLLTPEEAELVVPFADLRSEGFPADRVADLVPDAARVRERPFETLADESDWWIRALALHGLGRDHEITLPGRDPDQNQDLPMIPLIQRVMILKGSALFRDFPGQDLAGIAALSEVVHLEADETLFSLGEEGDAFYMVVKGGIRIVRNGFELSVLGPREGFGEMAILDEGTRSATAVAAEPTTLLRIHRDSFDQLVEQNPSVARGIYRMLTQRLRNTLSQLAAG